MGIEGEFGMALNSLPIDLVKGKTIKISSTIIATDIIDTKVGLWCGIDQPHGPTSIDEWTKMIAPNEPIFYTRYPIEIKVPQTANDFHFGLMAQGKSEVLFELFSITIDGEPYTDVEHKALTPEELQWLKNNILPLATTNPNATNDTDLAIVADLVGDSRVLAMGEVTHGIKEIFDMKHRIVKYMATKHNFGVFATEANMPECFAVNQNYLTDKQGSPEEHLASLYMWTWQTEEVKKMLEWMQDYKQRGGNINFAGFDMQITSGILQRLEEPLKNKPQQHASFKKLMMAMNKYTKGDIDHSVPMNTVNKFHDGIEPTELGYDAWWKLEVIALIQSLDMEQRDKHMADNLMLILKNHPNSQHGRIMDTLPNKKDGWEVIWMKNWIVNTPTSVL